MAIGIGIVIGVGIFRVPSEIASCLNGNAPLILLAWLTGGLISLCGALCYAELSAAYPETGGDYVFLRRAYGKLMAFLYGWTEVTIIRTGSIAAIAYLCAEYGCGLLALDKSWIKILGVCVVFLLTAINVIGLGLGRRIQNSFTLAKLIAIILLICGGLFFGHGDLQRLSLPALTEAPQPAGWHFVSSFGLALIPILWTYGGWQENVFVAGETKQAHKTLPFALTGVVLVVGLIYLSLNALFLFLVPPAELMHSKLVAADVLRLCCGEMTGKVMEALIVMYAIGSVNALIITGSRVTYAMAQDVGLFGWFARRSGPTETPSRALFLNSVAASVYILIGSFDKLLFFTGIAVWLFFALVCSSLFVLRRREAASERPFHVPFYPWLPAGFILVCLALCVNTLLTFPEQSLFGLALVATGIPVFYLSKLFTNTDVSKENWRQLMSDTPQQKQLVQVLSLVAALTAVVFTSYALMNGANVMKEFASKEKMIETMNSIVYNSAAWQRTHWLGVPMQQNPCDNQMMQQLIFELKPDVIIETGTFNGGSALFYATVIDQFKPACKIFTVDIEPHVEAASKYRVWKEHVTSYTASSTDPEIFDRIKKQIPKDAVVLVLLDSDHSRDHVYKELQLYAPLVTKGSYMVVQDTNVNGHPVRPDFGPGPMEALDDFLKDNHDFQIDRSKEDFLITFFPRGWLKKVR